MKFNLLTYIFEIINFFVLLWILKKLLYNPVISVLKKRKEFIDSRIREAEEAERKAEEIRKEYEKLSQELEEKRKQRLAEITKEVEEEKEKLLKRMREELDAERRKFLESLEEERRQVLRELKEEAVKLSLYFSSRILSQMADEHLHRKLLEIALETLKEMKEEGLSEDLSRQGSILIESAYPLSAEDLKRIGDLIRKTFGVEVDIRTTVRKDLIAGVKLHLASKLIDSSLEGQLQVLERRLKDLES